MKTYSIGRDINCDIVINDTTDVISRRHALLNVTSSGKMTIIDQSTNGTYVNGIRISPNVPFPVTRKDIISFAHISRLDWNSVPKENKAMRYVLFGLGGIIIIACLALGFKLIADADLFGNNKDAVAVIDSIELKNAEKARLDSLAKVAKADSLRKDSIKQSKARQAAKIKAKKEQEEQQAKDKEQQEKEQQQQEKAKENKEDKSVKQKQDVG